MNKIGISYRIADSDNRVASLGFNIVGKLYCECSGTLNSSVFGGYNDRINQLDKVWGVKRVLIGACKDLVDPKGVN